MVEAVTLFKTSDGKTFNSAVEAEAHEARASRMSSIEAFADAAGYKGAFRTFAISTIDGWEHHKATGILPTPKEPKVVKNPRKKKVAEPVAASTPESNPEPTPEPEAATSSRFTKGKKVA